MAILIPVMVGMLLGKAIDLRSYKVSTNVFSDENYQMQNSRLSAKGYYVASSSEDIYKAAGFPGDMALHVKANFINIDNGLNGLNGYLKETIWEDNTLLIIITMTYLSSIRGITDGSKPLENGMNAAYLANSTHYVKSQLYGGWLNFVHKLKTDHPKDMEKVKKEVVKTIKEAGKIDEKFFGSWQSLTAKFEKLDLRGKVHQEYKLYSSLPLGGEYLEPSSLLKSLDKFPDEVTKRGEGYGYAEAMWLYPLKEINSTFEEIKEGRDYDNELFKLNAMFDDLRDTQSLLLSWTTSLSIELTNEQEKHVSRLFDDVEDAMQVFLTTIPEISLYKEIDKNLLNRAFDAYERTLPVKGGSYHLAYRRLKESIDAVCQNSFHSKVLGQLKLDQDQIIGPVETPKGVEECKEKCLKESRCRAIAYGDKLSALDRETGVWEVQTNICWIHFRSTATTPFESSSEWIGDVHVYDRKCA